MPVRPLYPCLRQRCPNRADPGEQYCPKCLESLRPHPCLEPGCGYLVDGTEKYCQAHKIEREKYRALFRGNTTARGYGHLWGKVRARYIALNPLCEDCKSRGRILAADEVHHIDGNTRNNHDDNLMALCRPCHYSYGKKKEPN